MKKKGFIALGISALLLGIGFSISKYQNNHNDIIDNTVYDDPEVAHLDRPDYIGVSRKALDLESLSSITLHYHNDDGDCAKREFYMWASGVDGMYLADYCVRTATDMTMTIDFSQEPFDVFKGKAKLGLIVKYVGSWAGQSEDTFIMLEDFEESVIDNKLDLWIINGPGTSLEIYDNEADTKADKIKRAYFLDWKTIHCEATAVPRHFKLYGFDQNYLKLTSLYQSVFKNRYMFVEGTEPTNIKKYKDLTTDTDLYVFDLKLNYDAHPNVRYTVESEYETKPGIYQTVNVDFENLYEYKDSKGINKFEKFFNYSGELGAIYTPTKTTFRLWAPTSALVNLRLYDYGTPESLATEEHEGTDTFKSYKMHFRNGGIWELEIEGDLNGKYYTYEVTNQNGTNEVCDPYAKACGIDGIRGMVYNKEETNPDNWKDLPTKWDGTERDIKTPQELAIYEVHTRDLTMHDTWQSNEGNERGTFNAFREKGTTLTTKNAQGQDVTVTTGFDHIEEMNVNAVQLLPVFDHDDEEENMHFNWGYNPLNYNCVEGGYSSNPYDGEVRIKEYKELIQALANNKNKTRTIMDVVYNHLSSAANSNFTKIVPKYYFRYAKVAPNLNYTDSDVVKEYDYMYHNGSGCNNEVKSEAPMMSKFIVDSLVWWAKEYKVKGFRFDLMGLVDWRTLDAAKKALYEVDPDIYLYGEGWTADGSQSGNVDETIYDTWGSNTWTVYRKLHNDSDGSGNESDKSCFMGAFNDAARNALKGENSMSNFYGFITKGSDVGELSATVADMLIGNHKGTGGNPRQMVAYASCHDNFTLYDQFTYTAGGYHDSQGGWHAKEKWQELAASATATAECTVLMSNGVAFIHGGEELFRSKEVKSDADKKRIYTLDANTGTYYYKDTEMINGKMISHNSYNLSDEVNAFDYSRKVVVDGYDMTGYSAAIKNAVAMRKNMKKYVYKDMQAMYQLPNDQRIMNTWCNNGGNYDGATLIGMRNDKHFFFVSGCNVDPIPFGDIVYCGDPLFVSNPQGYIKGSDNITLYYYASVGFLSNK